MKKWILLCGLMGFLVWPRSVLADGTYANIGTTHSSATGADSVSWSQAFPITIDIYGNYIAPLEANGGVYYFSYSNDKGATWKENDFANLVSSFSVRPAVVYDSISDKLHVVDTNNAGNVVYWRFMIVRNSSYQITSIILDPAFTATGLTLDSITGCTSSSGFNPIVQFKKSGTYGTLVAFWGFYKTCGGSSMTETRAAMRVLSNSSADAVAGNWAALNGTSDASGAVGPANVAYNKLYGTNTNTSTQFQHSAVIEGGTSTHANDIYYFNSDENATNGFRRLSWNSGSSNWSGAWTTRVTFGGNVNNSQGYNLKDSLLSKPVYDSGHDRMYVGIARWLDNTNGDTQSLFYVDSSDTVNLAGNVYSAGGTHCIYPTFDLTYDSNTNKIYFFYDISGASSVCGNVYYKTYDGTSFGSATAFYTVANRSVDIPIVYQARDNDRLILFFRLNNASTPGTPPHEVYFGYVSLNSTASNSSVSGGTSPYSATTYADFNQACATLSSSQAVDNSGGEIALASSFRDDFDTPRTPYPLLFSDKWSTGVWSSGNFNPTPTGTLLVYGSGGAYALGQTAFNKQALKFKATFTNNTFQHIGWADGTGFNKYVIFSTKNNGQLNTRIFNGGSEKTVALGTGYFGSNHNYEIDWTATTITFIIDGSTVATDSTSETTGLAATSLFPIISDNDTSAGSNLTVDWLNIVNYPTTTGTYQTCAIDSGTTGEIWGTATFTTTVDGSTSVTAQSRTSDDNSSWSGWSSLTSGSSVSSAAGRYIQLLVTLTGTSSDTPSFNDISLAFSAPAATPVPSSNTANSGGSGGSNSSVPNPNCKSGWARCIAKDWSVGQVYVPPNAADSEIWVDVNKSDWRNLNVPLPWQEGLNTVGDIYLLKAVAAFNGYEVPVLNKPIIVVLPYDPIQLYGLAPKLLRMARFDSESGSWQVLPTPNVVDVNNHTVANTTRKLSYMVVVYPASVWRSEVGPVLGTSTESEPVTTPVPEPIPTPSPEVKVAKQADTHKFCVWKWCF